MNVIKNTLICFSKLCYDKNEKPIFYRRENQKLINFFEKEKTKYPEVFNNDSDLENELQNINLSVVKSLGPDNHPSFTLENFHTYYDGILNKNIFDKIALDFYNELGCLENGVIRNTLQKS